MPQPTHAQYRAAVRAAAHALGGWSSLALLLGYRSGHTVADYSRTTAFGRTRWLLDWERLHRDVFPLGMPPPAPRGARIPLD